MRPISTLKGVAPIALRALGLVAIAFILIPGVPAAGQVFEGTDCWQTEPGTVASIPALPASFFGPQCTGSGYGGGLVPMTGGVLTPAELANCDCPPAPPAEITWLDVHGEPVAAGSAHAVSFVPTQAPSPDTCVRRMDDATFPNGLGVPDPVPIELVELSLVSVNPIAVSCPGLTLWNVFVTEDGVQAQGTMELTPTMLSPLQGIATVPNLPIDVRFRFEPVGGGASVVRDANVNMQNPNPQSPGPPGRFRVLVGGVPALSYGWTPLLVAGLLVLGAIWLRQRRAARPAP